MWDISFLLNAVLFHYSYPFCAIFVYHTFAVSHKSQICIQEIMWQIWRISIEWGNACCSFWYWIFWICNKPQKYWTTACIFCRIKAEKLNFSPRCEQNWSQMNGRMNDPFWNVMEKNLTKVFTTEAILSLILLYLWHISYLYFLLCFALLQLAGQTIYLAL